jgi:predicted dehydrogenase
VTRQVKLGVLGAGYWGPKLIRNFQEIPDADMAIVCDLRQDRLAHIKELYPAIHVTTDYRELLQSDVEAVAIATPILTHHRLAKEALGAGKHVLVEKPLTANSEEAEDLVETADRLGLALMVGHTFEYNPAVEYLRKLIASGDLGRIYYLNATRVNLGIFQPDINVVWDLAPHDVSILMFVLGTLPMTVSARGGAFVRSKVHDVAYLTLQFPNDVMADVRVSWLDPCKIRRITVVGSKKMVVYDDVEPNEKIKIYDKGVDLPPYSDTLEEFHLSYRYGDITTPAISGVEPLRVECQHFLNCIRTGERPRSDGRDGLEVVRILEAATRSLLNGGTGERIRL